MFTALGPHGWLVWPVSASQRCCFRIGGILLFVFAALGPHDRYSDRVKPTTAQLGSSAASSFPPFATLPLIYRTAAFSHPSPCYPLGAPILKTL
jgi:hypothetical protein